jgi:hypothetical protein
MDWYLSNRADERALPIADRHYNRQKVGSPQFVPPGRCLVLLTKQADALWVTSWPLPEYVKHAWPGAWVCSCFRNESTALSSDLILQAVAATRWKWPDVPQLGMITFINPKKVRKKRDFGRCFLRAGFVDATCPLHTAKEAGCQSCLGMTKDGLVAKQLWVGDMPDAESPLVWHGDQPPLFPDLLRA